MFSRNRSQRLHKPTEKFLNYFNHEINSPNRRNIGKQKTPQLLKSASLRSSTTKKLSIQEINSSNERSTRKQKTPQLLKSASLRSSTTKKLSIQGRRKLLNNEVELLCAETTLSPPKTTPEIRRSCRKQKPNQRLKEFVHVPSSGNTPKPKKTPSTEKFLSKSFLGFETSNIVKKNIATISPMVKRDGIQTPVRSSKHITVCLVDCLKDEETLSRLPYPFKVTPNSVISSNRRYERKASNIDSKKNHISNKVKETENRKGIKRPITENRIGIKRPITENRKGIKRPITESSMTIRETRLKKKRSNVVGICERSNSVENNLNGEVISPRVPRKCSKIESLSDGFSHSVDADDDNCIKNASTSPNSIIPARMVGRNSEERSCTENQTQDIRETLKKFLIMGTKVASAISETLKNNEEALLSKSSAFEKKCLNLVNALAEQGTDLNEEDMEKVLMLLDEEQEERKIYRHTFLESLRVSHLTNMALYSQMLRLLKTL